jgi:hypothetical protein
LERVGNNFPKTPSDKDCLFSAKSQRFAFS